MEKTIVKTMSGVFLAGLCGAFSASVLPACFDVDEPDDGAKHDAGGDSDVDGDSDTGTGGDGDTDTGSDTGTDLATAMVDCDGGKEDPATGLCWQEPPSAGSFALVDAIAYCAGLASGGHTDWRVPSISELRSLVRGCPSLQTGGGCGVTDDCLSLDCLGDGSCAPTGCDPGEGPGEDGDYLDPGLTEPTICSMSWSSSPVTEQPDQSWIMWFNEEIGIYTQNVADLDLVRCVRTAD